jgi:asparagine synthase (glutamine-hydrolysing)
MSGIFAIISEKENRIEDAVQAAEYMTGGLAAYGRADSGYEILGAAGKQVILGGCISGMHAEVPAGKPVIMTRRFIAVCDAIIYNRNEMLRALLAGGDVSNEMRKADLAGKDVSDEELLVIIYETLGARGLFRVNGDFAAVLVSRSDGSVRLLRDHIGVRPLYYVRTDGRITVSTDYRPMLHLGFINARINEDMVYDALTLGSLASETDTAFANVKKAVHGSITRFSGDQAVKTERFYIPGERKAKKRDYDEEYYDEAAKLLRDAVRIRCEAVSGAKIGCEFSGGLDSGMVTALIDELADQQNTEKPVVFTWSPSPRDYQIRETDSGKLRDEREVITRFCAEKGNTCIFRNAQEATNQEKILSRGTREEICEYETGIIADSMEALADAKVRAVFSGWGGDEGISMRFGPFHLAQAGEYRAYFKAAGHASGGSPKKYLGFLRRTVRYLHESQKPWNGIRANGLNFSVVQPAFAEEMRRGHAKKKKYFGVSPEKNLLSGTLESRTLLAASAGADAGVMYLFPLLDARVLDFALTVPRRLYIDGDTKRVLPQRALSDILPDYLTTFAGTSNVEKEDTGRMDFYTEIEEKAYGVLTDFYFEHIDRLRFEDYLDFDEMKKTISEEKDPVIRTVLRNMLRLLYKMQLLMR